MYRLLLHEITNKTEGGLAADLSALSAKYSVGDITKAFVDPDVITQACRQASYDRQWREHLAMRHVPPMILAKKQETKYTDLPWNLSRGLQMHDLGLLVMKTNFPHLMLDRNMASPQDRSCLHAMCDGRDEWDHIMNHCRFYSSKLRETDNPHRDLAEFISSVNLERIRNFSQSLIMFGDGEELLANEMLDSDFVTTARNRYSMEAVVSLADRADGISDNQIKDVICIEKRVKTHKLSQLCVARLEKLGTECQGSRLGQDKSPKIGWGLSASSSRCRVAETCDVVRNRGLGSGKRVKKTNCSPIWPQYLTDQHSTTHCVIRSLKTFIMTKAKCYRASITTEVKLGAGQEVARVESLVFKEGGVRQSKTIIKVVSNTSNKNKLGCSVVTEVVINRREGANSETGDKAMISLTVEDEYRYGEEDGDTAEGMDVDRSHDISPDLVEDTNGGDQADTLKQAKTRSHTVTQV